MSQADNPDATKELTPPVDAWVTLRIGGDKITKAEAKADEEIRLEVRRRKTDA